MRPLFLIFVMIFASQAFGISSIEGLKWGQTPNEVAAAWNGKFELAEQPEDPLGKVLYELRYKGTFMNTYPDGRISAIFYLNRLFAVAIAYGSNSTRPACVMFEELINRVQAKFGPYKKRSYPPQMHSNVAIKDIPPINQMPDDEKQKLDVQIRTAFWIPEATWKYENGATIRVLISRGPPKPGSMPALSPLLIFSKANLLE